MAVPHVGPVWRGLEIILKGVPRWYGTLGDEWSSVHKRRPDLVYAVPMDGEQLPVHTIGHLNLNGVVLADLRDESN